MQTTFSTYMHSAEEGYGRYPIIPYHNNVHATDVVHSCFAIIAHPSLQDTFSDMEVSADVDSSDNFNSIIVITVTGICNACISRRNYIGYCNVVIKILPLLCLWHVYIAVVECIMSLYHRGCSF